MQNVWPALGQLIGLLIAIFLIAAVIATAGTPLTTTSGVQPVVVATTVVANTVAAPAGQAAPVVVQPATLPTALPLPTAIDLTGQAVAPAAPVAPVVAQPAVLPTAIVIAGDFNNAGRSLVVVEAVPQVDTTQGNDIIGHTSEPSCSYRIKAIVENNDRRYYRPDDPNYAAKTVNASNGDRWFCDLSSAQNAGWRDAALP